MGYQRGSGYQRGNNKQQQANPAPQQQSSPAPQQQAQPQQSGGKRGSKPTHSVYVVERNAEGKTVAARDNEGKVIYVGAGWENKFSLEIVLDDDVPKGTRVRVSKKDKDQ